VVLFIKCVKLLERGHREFWIFPFESVFLDNKMMMFKDDQSPGKIQNFKRLQFFRQVLVCVLIGGLIMFTKQKLRISVMFLSEHLTSNFVGV